VQRLKRLRIRPLTMMTSLLMRMSYGLKKNKQMINQYENIKYVEERLQLQLEMQPYLYEHSAQFPLKKSLNLSFSH
jgi:hypothetical protein